MTESGGADFDLFDITRRDLAELCRLSHEYFAELVPYDGTLLFIDNWDKRYGRLMQLGLDSDRFFIRGARIGEQIVGFIMFGYRVEELWEVANRGYISNIYVAPSWRRKGIGRRMVLDAIETLKASGSSLIELEVYERNEAGTKFWAQFGFQPFKFRRRLMLDDTL
jgi:ribosomal protein S18 acetylase RimI-like enzyme